MKTDPNERAFPTGEVNTGGLTKREYFAAMAMEGLLSNSAIKTSITEQQYATLSVNIADELINALNKQS